MTTRERILLLQENRVEQHVIAATLGLEEAIVSRTLREQSYTPADPTLSLAALAAAQPFIVKTPEEYGARGIGLGHDDQLAIIEAIEAAVAECIANESYYAEVWFSAKRYGALSPTTKGGSTKANSQIPLPFRSPREPKVTLVLRGVTDASALGHWHQLGPQLSGAVIESALEGLSVDGEWGAPSILGGPTKYTDPDGGASFSNLLVVVDGLTVVGPKDPGIIALDFLKVAEANIPNALTMSKATLTQMRESIATNELGIGLRMPAVGNNDNCCIGNFTCAGFAFGVVPNEHFTAQRLCMLYNDVALLAGPLSGAPTHGGSIDYMSVEGGKTAIQIEGDSGGGSAFPLNIGLLDVEEQTGEYDIVDVHHGLRGEIGWAENTARAPKVNGAAHARIIDLQKARGTAASPTLESGKAVTNPYWRDAWVTITGATKVELDGAEQYALTGVLVPSGATVKVTGAELDWKWTLL